MLNNGKSYQPRGCTIATPVVAVTTGEENVSLLTKDQLEIREKTQEKGYAKLRVNIYFAEMMKTFFLRPL